MEFFLSRRSKLKCWQLFLSIWTWLLWFVLIWSLFFRSHWFWSHCFLSIWFWSHCFLSIWFWSIWSWSIWSWLLLSWSLCFYSLWSFNFDLNNFDLIQKIIKCSKFENWSKLIEYFWNFIEFFLICPTNDGKQVDSNFCYFTTIPGVWVGGLDELKLRPTQFKFNWICLLEVSLAITFLVF